MAVVKKKIWPEYFELVRSGKKNFELRLNDFKINEPERRNSGKRFGCNPNEIKISMSQVNIC